MRLSARRVVTDGVPARAHRCGGPLGGPLIGRYYVQRPDRAFRVRHLVTLGTPHRGTSGPMRVIFSEASYRACRRWLRDRRSCGRSQTRASRSGVRLTSVYSRSDSICPPSSCRLESQRRAHLKNVEVARVGHLEFPFSARISSIISRELESVAPPRVGRARFAGAASRRLQATATLQPRMRSAARTA